MDISPTERFLSICRFERPGDLCMLTSSGNTFWEPTLKEWVKQGAPGEIMDARFRGDYFQFQHIRWLAEIRSGMAGADVRKVTDLGQGIRVGEGGPPIVPAYEPEIVTEDERTVTLKNGVGQTIKYIKKDIDRMMPTFLDWPVKDRATWE